MTALILSSVRPGEGKTALTAALGARFLRAGRKVVISAGRPADVGAWPEALVYTALLPDAVVLGPESTTGGSPQAGQARHTAGRLMAAAGTAGVVLVEGGAADTARELALAEAVDGLVVLVARLDDDIVPAARAYGARLAGVVINNVPRYRSHKLADEVVPSLERQGVKYLGAIPEDRRLLAPTIGLVAEHLGAQFALLTEKSDMLIDNFLIGGLVLDWGPTYFGSQENTGVVVRGDRPDVQIAALQTDTTRAMVLTKGIAPIEYVLYEARERGVPIVVSPFDTHQTALRLESLLPKIRFDHPAKLACLLELVESRLDLAAIDSAVAQPATR